MTRLHRRRFLLGLAQSVSLLAASAVVGSCSPGSGLPPLPESVRGSYRLGADDELQITTYGEDRLSGKFKVSAGGNVAMPLIGAVKAAGLTTAELEHSIATRLREAQIVVDPKVSVEISEYRPIYVMGEVTKPGPYPFKPGMTVLTAVAVAGGFTYRAQTDQAAILRTVDDHSVEGRAPRTAVVLPGDVITILERYF